MPDASPPRPTEPAAEVVTLCGSTRFEAEFAELGERLTLEGCVVLGPGLFTLPDRAAGSVRRGRSGGVSPARP